jgi:hypothetical protein
MCAKRNSLKETAALDNSLLYHHEMKAIREETNAAIVAIIAIVVIFHFKTSQIDKHFI